MPEMQRKSMLAILNNSNWENTDFLQPDPLYNHIFEDSASKSYIMQIYTLPLLCISDLWEYFTENMEINHKCCGVYFWKL